MPRQSGRETPGLRFQILETPLAAIAGNELENGAGSRLARGKVRQRSRQLVCPESSHDDPVILFAPPGGEAVAAVLGLAGRNGKGKE